MPTKSRLKSLEKAVIEAAEPEPPWASPKVYKRLREDARDDIERALEIGKEPLFWIDDGGVIRAVDDDSFVRHLGDYVRAGDRKIESLEREITEAEAAMTPEELAQQRAWDEEFDARTNRLSLDGKIEALEAEIAALNAEEAEGEGGA